MKPEQMKLVLMAAVIVSAVLSGRMFLPRSGDDLVSHDLAYAQEEPGHGHDHDDHAVCDGHGTEPGREEHEEVEDNSDHEGHAHGEACDHDTDQAEHHDHAGHEHHEEDIISLSPDAVRMAGINISTARMDKLHRVIELPGEITFNEDRLVHVTPRFPGVTREVHGRIGAYVSQGTLLAVLESNESLSRYNITAAISGRIIEKHLAVGEFAAEDHDMFVIANLSTVWADFDVYAKDLAFVREGARIRISTVEGDRSTEAVLSYVAPLYDRETRSALARAVITNDGELWRPGTFVRAELALETEGERLLIDKHAVQALGEESIVFVPAEESGAFEFMPVLTGASDDHSVEVLSGLTEGARYVTDGAFELKAKMVTANMGAHAGHGH